MKGAIERACDHHDARKRAVAAGHDLQIEVDGGWLTDRDRHLRALIYGTNVDVDELEEFLATSVSWAMHSLATDGPHFGPGPILDGLLTEVFLLGYYTRQFEGA